MLWHAYARKHGGLPAQRIAFLLAQMCTMFNNAHGGRATLHDFLPALPEPEPQTIGTADDFLNAFE